MSGSFEQMTMQLKSELDQLKNKLRAEEDRHAGNYEQWMETERRLRSALEKISKLYHIVDDRKTVDYVIQIAKEALSDKA